MKTIRMALVVVTLAVLGGALVLTQSGQDLFQQALVKEQADGDLRGAIAIYQRIVRDFASDRTLAAKALVQMGRCYEKLGQAEASEARKAYERVVREFGEQKDLAAEARARLAGLTSSTEPQKPTFRQIRIPTKLPADGSGKLSPDGQTLAYVEGGSLWAMPVHGKSDPNIAGAPIRLTDPMHAWDTGNICVEWSPDGKWIGVVVEPPRSGKDGTPVEELHVVPAAGGTPRRVHARVEGWAGAAYTLRYALSAGADVLYFAAGKELKDLRIYSVPTRGGDARPVTAPITREPTLSPDGSKIAYVRGENFKERLLNSKEIWVASVDGSAAQLAYRLPDDSPGAEVRGPIWSPDGQMLAFLTRMPQRLYSRVVVLSAPVGGGPAGEPALFELPGTSGTDNLLAGWTRNNRIGMLMRTEERRAIYTVPAAGGRAVQLTPKAGIEPAWTPDGKHIYFLGFHGGDRVGLEVVPAEGGPVERLALGGGYSENRWGINGDLSVSPDGLRICFPGAETRENEISLGVFTLSMREKLPTRLTTHGNGATGGDGHPVWSPDGKSIAFIRADLDITSGNTTANIHVIPREGGKLRQVTTAADRVRLDSLAWSPDGRAIAFSAGDKTLRIVPAAGGASRILAEVAGSGLTWSPDGKTLAYVLGGALWRIPAEGGTPTRIETGLDARLRGPAWSPDGETIAFSATSGGREHELWLMEDFLRLVKTVR